RRAVGRRAAGHAATRHGRRATRRRRHGHPAGRPRPAGPAGGKLAAPPRTAAERAGRLAAQPDRPARRRRRAAALTQSYRGTTMRIAIAGASGRMGRMLIEAVLNAPDLELAVALDRSGSAALGQDAGAFLGRDTGVAITDRLDALADADCLVDFTRPEATAAHLQACVRHGTRMVIGTPGFDDNGRAAIEVAAQKIAIVFAPNMSVNVNATLKLLDVAARILNSGYDVEVFEAHHRNKVDAPSGTALKMGETIASAWNVALPDVATWTRHGDTGVRKPGTIGFSVVRGGDIV